MSARMSSKSPRIATPASSDIEFLQGIAWERAAPRDIVAAAAIGDPARFATAYRQWLRSQQADARANNGPLLTAWSLAVGVDPTVAKAIAAFAPASNRNRARRPVIKAAASWTDRAQALIAALLDQSAAALATPVGLLAALELLATGGSRLPVTEWWLLWRATLSAVIAKDDDTLAPDVALLRDGELPLLTGLVFGPVLGMSSTARDGRRLLGRRLIAETDTDGTPASALLSRLPLWLAPLVRATVWSQRFHQPLWNGEQAARFNDVVERTVALSRADGRLALTNGLPSEPLPMLLVAADLLEWPAGHPARSCLQSLTRLQAQPTLVSKLRKPSIAVMPSVQSDWARFALLRTDWSAGAASVAVAHHASLPELDVTIDGQPLIHGPWGLDLQLGDTGIELADEWACVCWESDPDADYAELQMTGPKRLRVERMVLLSRKDQFLFIADAVSGAPKGRMHYRSRLPFAPGVRAEREPGRRELRLTMSRAKARVFPLALPEDTVNSTPHRCELVDDGLVLEQTIDGQGLLAPLVIDWHPQRRSADALWRQLTVTENGRVLGGDAAGAFRWKVGKDQWLVYRSLKPGAVPRAVLGQHTANETLIGRFDAKGEVDTIVTIES
ncbi:MAG TPA: hypothetical protein VM165_10605 [Planctomycetaceae bacterium]|nr:hypothetical protein [Planctomycetaceae bacterium]